MSSTPWITKLRQHPERAVPDSAHEFLAQGYVAHVGFEQDGRPYVIPMLYHYAADRPDRLYLHGGVSSRALEHLASGVPVCATVTRLDGLVYSRDAKYHSANYRSVMCFGRGRLMRVRLANAFGVVRGDESRVSPRRKPGELRIARGEVADRREHIAVDVERGQRVEHFAHARYRGAARIGERVCGGTHGEGLGHRETSNNSPFLRQG